MIIRVDIDGTITNTIGADYDNSKPIQENIDKINKLYDESHTIIYWTASGSSTSPDNWRELTKKQIDKWGCKFHELKMGKPHYDLFICDKTKRIEEI